MLKNVTFAGEPVAVWDSTGVPVGLLSAVPVGLLLAVPVGLPLAVLLGGGSTLVKKSYLDSPIDVILLQITNR